MRKWLLPLFLLGLFAFVVAPAVAEAAAAFGRQLQRTRRLPLGGARLFAQPRHQLPRRRGGGSNFIFLPGFGWGWGGYGGGGGMASSERC